MVFLGSVRKWSKHLVQTCLGPSFLMDSPVESVLNHAGSHQRGEKVPWVFDFIAVWERSSETSESPAAFTAAENLARLAVLLSYHTTTLATALEQASACSKRLGASPSHSLSGHCGPAWLVFSPVTGLLSAFTPLLHLSLACSAFTQVAPLWFRLMAQPFPLTSEALLLEDLSYALLFPMAGSIPMLLSLEIRQCKGTNTTETSRSYK